MILDKHDPDYIDVEEEISDSMRDQEMAEAIREFDEQQEYLSEQIAWYATGTQTKDELMENIEQYIEDAREQWAKNKAGRLNDV